MSAETRPVLAAEGITQRFGPVEVLSDVSLTLLPGEVHALIGENGAGKSTLMKILSGHLVPTGGRVLLDGAPLGAGGVREAERRGVVLVHQEILLAPDLTAAENIFLGREPRRGLVIDRRAMNRDAGAALADLGAQIPPDTPVHRLSIAQRQLVQIARALLVPHRAVIFDEPTASLTPHETEALIAVIRRIRERGVGILYISHRLPEVKLLATRVTVLRDGRRVDTVPAETLDTAGMARLMVGRDVARLYPERADAGESAETVLEAEDVQVPGFVHGASFRLGRGEILGFAGLVGAGRTELMEGILALRPATGCVRLDGREVRFRKPADAMRAGIVYLSEDRKGKGLLLAQDLRTNLTLAALRKFAGGLGINRAREDAALQTAIREFDIRTRDPRLLAGQLSGGNQQKLLLAKMMLLDPRIVVIDEPTRGIDIGTKAEIYRFVAELAKGGTSVIVVSSEMPELIGLCDRILVMREGRVAGEVAGERMTERAIVMLATGTNEKEAALVAEDA
ncbi:sugar ABC transporter ATP-binding protein [Aureimonas jatrophae]|uniref:Monosaccharide ABC transporter ATP-binding protein, CUT2 family n=1 Tax=Aureimonas jatrophae TaxID=1166073 RepID=A0A1H0HWQ9_9HYPH|nr:sugar ABC transporter ATP-binding protein [Aureimonas jatrophae]MBB3950818.1 ribose transport system ATP-binding protein [Aureimonas jatrophae]SDO23638.1 monosaccharide ABC transporter ATP-binding protein, CUT2 family [Aureimonas jatrophae]